MADLKEALVEYAKVHNSYLALEAKLDELSAPYFETKEMLMNAVADRKRANIAVCEAQGFEDMEDIRIVEMAMMQNGIEKDEEGLYVIDEPAPVVEETL